MSSLTIEERSVSPESQLVNVGIHVATISLYSLSVLFFDIQWKRKNVVDVDRYLTARKMFGWVPMSLSFFVTAGGAWSIFGIPSYVVDPDYGIGLGGLFVLAFANSMSMIAMSIIGPKINSRFPTITSWNDFASKKFGMGAQSMVAISSLVSIFSSITYYCFTIRMYALAFIAEYTGTAKLMSSLYHIPPIYSIISTGLLTMIYSTVVGLSASLFTDSIQSALILVLLIFGFSLLSSYDLSVVNEPQNLFLGFTDAGFDSIFTVGIGTFSYYLFSDMCWQRLIASENASSTRKGVYIGSLLTLICIISIGYISIMSIATTDKSGNQELRVYYSILSCQNCVSTLGIRILKAVVMVIAIIINATSIDNCQACITATITSYIITMIPKLKGRKKLSITLARSVQLMSNLACIAAATLGLKIISFYLLSTLIAASFCAPFILAFNETAAKQLTSFSVFLVFLLTTFTNILYYYIVESRDIVSTIKTYYFDEYRKETFIVCVFAPYVYTLLICCVNYIMKKKITRLHTSENYLKG